MKWIPAIALIVTVIGGVFAVGLMFGNLKGSLGESIKGIQTNFSASVNRLDGLVERLENTTSKLTDSVNTLNTSVAVLETTVAFYSPDQKQVVSLSPDTIEQLATAIAKKNGI